MLPIQRRGKEDQSSGFEDGNTQVLNLCLSGSARAVRDTVYKCIRAEAAEVQVVCEGYYSQQFELCVPTPSIFRLFAFSSYLLRIQY